MALISEQDLIRPGQDINVSKQTLNDVAGYDTEKLKRLMLEAQNMASSTPPPSLKYGPIPMAPIGAVRAPFDPVLVKDYLDKMTILYTIVNAMITDNPDLIEKHQELFNKLMRVL